MGKRASNHRPSSRLFWSQRLRSHKLIQVRILVPPTIFSQHRLRADEVRNEEASGRVAEMVQALDCKSSKHTVRPLGFFGSQSVWTYKHPGSNPGPPSIQTKFECATVKAHKQLAQQLSICIGTEGRGCDSRIANQNRFHTRALNQSPSLDAQRVEQTRATSSVVEQQATDLWVGGSYPPLHTKNRSTTRASNILYPQGG